MDLDLARALARPYRVTRGASFRLKDFSPADTGPLSNDDKPHAKQALEDGRGALSRLQDMLYAHNQWSVLLVFQAMDAAGKDSAIKHVMSGVNPQGCQVFSFKAPSAEELDHDWMWRCWRALPERGRIGIFNRSYYEEVLVVKVHPAILAGQKLPAKLVGKRIWDERYQDIRGMERHLARNGTLILKFFLNVSKRRAEEAVPRAARRSGEGLEVQRRRRQGARALEGLHEGVPVDDPRNRGAARAVVRRARRQQVVHAHRRRGGDRRCAVIARPRLSERRPRQAHRTRRRPQGAAREA